MSAPITNMSSIIGSHDLLFITLDTLRYDVAQQLFEAGLLPCLSQDLPSAGWERRHSPGTFTYAAHHAFFAGFLPTPAQPGRHPRLMASKFGGSETTTPQTWVFEEDNFIHAAANLGYHTICIGGVGFFNKQNAIGSVFPSLFEESHWDRTLGVTDPDSTQHQFELARARLGALAQRQPALLFINVSALHQPNYFYAPGHTQDSIETHAAAMRYVDSQWPLLRDALTQRARPTFCIICADHGTAYGEAGFYGHRLAHDTVTTVPYAEFTLLPTG